MKLSIVATLYQSAPYISEFYKRASKAAQQLVGDDYEIILVNDGSPDNSLELAIQLTENDDHVVVVDLSRNFGHHKAMMSGLTYTRGDRIFLIDSDLEEDPEYLISFAKQMETESCDIVYGIQERRKGGWFERWSGSLYYRLYRGLTGIDFPTNVVTARLMSRRFTNALLLHEEREMFLGGLCQLTGFRQAAHTVKKHSTSETTYNLSRKIVLLINSVTSISNRPLVGIFYLGISIFLFATLNVAYLAFLWIFMDRPPGGWTSVMTSIWLLGGLMISLIGIVGIYLSKIFIETKQRPNSIVRHIYGSRHV
jgi:putative glycosyltransferase